MLTTQNRISSLVKSLFILIALTSCGKASKFESYQAVESNYWHKDSLFSFSVNFNEPEQAYNVMLNVRNKQEYPYSNLWLFVKVESPNGSLRTDTVELSLATPAGEWTGSGLGTLFDNKFNYKNSVLFPDTGQYLFSVQHGMRTDKLEGISDIGISIEEVK